jgi:hypothetical protein
MKYAPDFPEHLKRAVDAAIHRAEVDYVDAIAAGVSGYVPYIKSILFAFGKQCVLAAKEGLWTGERVRTALDEFLESLSTKVFYDKFTSGKKGEMSIHAFNAEVRKYSKKWDEWREIQDQLKQVFERECLPQDLPEEPVSRQTQREHMNPKELRDAYLATLPEKILILDICWAANQRYCEWKRWLRGLHEPGSTPDRAFRALLSSGKVPGEYRKQPRPNGWQ